MENSTIKANIKGVPLSKKVLVTVGQASILFNLDREEVEEILRLLHNVWVKNHISFMRNLIS